MQTILLTAQLVAIVALGAGVALAWRRLRPAPTIVGRTVVIVTKDDETIRGVMVAEHSDQLHLRDAVYVSQGEGTRAIGGLFVVLRSNIGWMHLPSTSEE